MSDNAYPLAVGIMIGLIIGFIVGGVVATSTNEFSFQEAQNRGHAQYNIKTGEREWIKWPELKLKAEIEEDDVK